MTGYWMYTYAVIDQEGKFAYCDVWFTTQSPASAFFSLNPSVEENGKVSHVILSGLEITAEQYEKSNKRLNR